MQPVRRWAARVVAVACACATVRFAVPWWCARDAAAWYRGDAALQDQLANELVAFEADDDARAPRPPSDRFTGEWALVTHQMVALGLAQICLARPERTAALAPVITRAAAKTFRPEMRDFGTKAWTGEDAMESLASDHGHAYLAWAALAVGMARLIDPAFPAELAAQHDALIAAYERRMLASATGLIETYPHEAYPTDVAAVAAAIAIHTRATQISHREVLRHWADRIRTRQIDPTTGLVVQRMDAVTGAPHDVPRASGTAVAAYFAGFADRDVAHQLAQGLLGQLRTQLDFAGIREYPADGPTSDRTGDVDSGPVLLGIGVSATGFALAPIRTFGDEPTFTALYRTVDLFGLPALDGDRRRFAIGGPIGNAILLALLTSGPEVAP